jgi:acyl-CoA synthetase (AMP-forming)/AMP-acid ligase II
VRIPNRTLLQWLDDPPGDRGLHFARAGEGWDHVSYIELRELTLRVSAACAERGIRRGDVIVVIQRCSPGFVAGMFGAFAAGATACSIAPPFAYQHVDDYERHLRHVLGIAKPALIIADDESLPRVAPVAALAGLAQPVTFGELVSGVSPATRPAAPADAALMQFTSGSSGFSRGVWISTSALEANLNAMHSWLLWSAADPGINWLPVHHDMGLIGGTINFVVAGCDGWMMQPDDFIRSPKRYLTCISENRVKIAPTPNFGLAYILRRVRPAELDGLSFDSMRALVIGAERIDPQVLTDFERLLGPFGLRHSAIVPAFGGAEATLAATGLPVTEGWTTSLPDGERPGATPVVGCGRPLDGVEVRVEDEQGAPVADGTIGEIVVTGRSMAAGYVGDPGTASGTRLDGGVLRTGDAGFRRDGQLFVLGRFGDGLKIRGRMVFAESLEAKLGELGIPARRATVLLGVRDGEPTAAVLMEMPKPEWLAIADQVLREHLEETTLLSVRVRRGGLAVTSSGKPRRRVMWQMLCEGTIAGEIGPLSPGPAPVPPPESASTMAGVG